PRSGDDEGGQCGDREQLQHRPGHDQREQNGQHDVATIDHTRALGWTSPRRGTIFFRTGAAGLGAVGPPIPSNHVRPSRVLDKIPPGHHGPTDQLSSTGSLVVDACGEEVTKRVGIVLFWYREAWRVKSSA